MTRAPRALVVLALVAVVEAVTWACVMPPLQGPDEVGHFSYAQKIVEAGRIPWNTVGWAPAGATNTVSSETSQAMSAAAIEWTWANPQARPAGTELEERWWERDRMRISDELRADGGFTSAMVNPPAYYLYESVPYAATSGASLFDRALLMRLANLPLLLVVVVFTWLIAGELLGRVPWLQALATGAVVLQPQLIHITATVNPDIALAAIWSAALYVMIRAVKDGLTRGRLAWLAGLVILSGLTQPRGLVLTIPVIAAVALAWRRHGPEDTARRRAVLVALAAASVVGVVVLVGYAVASSPSLLRVRQFLSYVWQFYLPRLGFMDPAIGPKWELQQVFIDRLFGGFAQLEVGPPEWVVSVLSAGALVLLAMALTGAWTWRARIVRRADLAAVLVLAVASYLLVLHVVSYRSLLKGPDPIITGRYLLTLVPLYGAGIALAVAWLPRRLAVAAATVVLVGLTFAQLMAFGRLFERFYA